MLRGQNVCITRASMYSYTFLRTVQTRWMECLQQPFLGHCRLTTHTYSDTKIPSLIDSKYDLIHSKIDGLCGQNKLKKAVDQLYAIDPKSTYTGNKTYRCLIECCSSVGLLKEAERIHQHIIESGQIKYLSQYIIAMYIKCRSLQDAVLVFNTQANSHVINWNVMISGHAELGTVEDARKVFDAAPSRNIVSWNAMIAAYAKHGCSKQAFDLFEKMVFEQKWIPIKNTYVSLLKAFDSPGAVEEGRLAHAYIVCKNLEVQSEIASAIIHMYGRCGCIDEALKMLERGYSKNVPCWSSLISSCVQNGKCEAALGLFRQMYDEGLEPNAVIFTKVLDALTKMGCLENGKIVHSLIIESKFEVIVNVCNALMLMYSRCRCAGDALKIFDKMSERDFVSWSLIIKVHIQSGDAKEAVRLFKQMQDSGTKPTEFTFSTVIDGIASSELSAGHLIHSQAVDYGVETNVVVNTALIDMYARCACLFEAQWLFENFVEKDIVLWTKMIALYCHRGNFQGALDLLERMEYHGVKPDKLTYVTALSACASPAALSKGERIHCCLKDEGYEADDVVRTALINMYARCGCLNVARKMFDEFPKRDVISWTGMIAAYLRDDNYKEALQLFNNMCTEGVQPNQATFVTIVDACTKYAMLEDGKIIHKKIIDGRYESDATVGLSLSNMYITCGSLQDVQRVFSKISEPDVRLWNLVIAAYIQFGKSNEALQQFEKMCEQSPVKPNRVTFVHVLSACSHANLVDKGLQYFDSMKLKYGIVPSAEHYNCMVDLLGRAGRLEEAEHYINEMPSEPGVVVWMTMLNACKLWGDVDRGERSAERVLNLDEENDEAYKLLASIYNSVGREQDALSIEKLRKAKQGLASDADATGSSANKCKEEGVRNVEHGPFLYENQ